MEASDDGYDGTGGIKAASLSIQVAVAGVNDAPVVVSPPPGNGRARRSRAAPRILGIGSGYRHRWQDIGGNARGAHFVRVAGIFWREEVRVAEVLNTSFTAFVSTSATPLALDRVYSLSFRHFPPSWL